MLNSIQMPGFKKGLKRFTLLLMIGYILRYPTHKIIDFSNISLARWKIFFAVDALHIIAFGILFIIVIYFISNRYKINFQFIAVFMLFFIIVVSPYILRIDWQSKLPLPLASYFYRGTGSIFPLFPWLAYMFAGAIFGDFISKNREVVNKIRFSYGVFIVGVLLLLTSFLFNQINAFVNSADQYWLSKSALVVYRLGIILLLCGVLSFSATKISSIPRVITMLGRHTLLIYTVHLVIIYGCAWSPGLSKLFGRTFNTEEVILAASIMILLMTGLVISLEKIKLIKNRKFAPIKI